ncbi:S9 family peptidase [Zhouia sp. PK063]|uniref:S9 family peptidase n=1 Tax=Zhouia sp. PK063 TaxID=3373602 RepID=UPI0037AD6322
MKKTIIIALSILSLQGMKAQEHMTPELLWKVKRVSVLGVSKDGEKLVYKVTLPNVEENNSSSTYYTIPIAGGEPTEIEDYTAILNDKNISPDGKLVLYNEEVQVENILAKDLFKDLDKSTAHVYTSLDYRHWDKWNTGKYNHVFYKKNEDGAEGIDIMKDEPYYSPQAPFGGDEDYTWAPDSNAIYYVSKKEKGTAYVISTNTDIYKYDIATGETENITPENHGYDTQPAFSANGNLAYLQMKTDGYESDKNDIIVKGFGKTLNLTSQWDGTVNSFKWSNDGKKIYFTAAIDGTIQLFEVDYPGKSRKMPVVQQISEGEFDVTGIVSETKHGLIVTRTDMNHATEAFNYNFKKKTFKQLTHVNDELYAKLDLPKVEKKYITTTDGKKMLVWVILPPNFDATKKYPTLLYCQGGPQSPLSQFYSFRWNFQLMASQGYIVVAPNRRGMPGHGVKWNEEISKDWGGQAMKDYLTAIDALAKEPYVDNNRLGAVGASYGGYSIYQLAGIHENRFKTFIAHDGVFDTRSMYGTTEELFFVNHDFGGPYWDKSNTDAQKAYNEFNPIEHVAKWNTPILIIQGGIDYRVPIEQGLEAFQAAQLQGIKSKLLYFPDENHWVLHPQNAIVWQREFFNWLKETL